MDTPNPELMHFYGTDLYYLEKCGAFRDVLRLAAPIGWMGLVAHNQQEEERHRQEAEAMNLAIRAAEAERMRPTLQGFFGHGIPRQPAPEDYSDPEEATQALGKFAERVGRSMARREMVKAAVGQLMGDIQAPSRQAQTLPAMYLPKPAQQTAVMRTAAPAAPAAPVSTLGVGGPYRTMPGEPLNTPPSMKLNPPKGKAEQVVQSFKPTASGPRVPKPGAPNVKFNVPGGPKKPWISGATKLKGLGVLGAAGLAYGGYKLINKAKQKMDEPHMGGQAWGQTAPPVFTGISEYSHPVY